MCVAVICRYTAATEVDVVVCGGIGRDPNSIQSGGGGVISYLRIKPTDCLYCIKLK